MKESEIIYERGAYWVRRAPSGRTEGTFEVYKTGATHSTRCAVIGYRGEVGIQKAIAEIDRRILRDAP